MFNKYATFLLLLLILFSPLSAYAQSQQSGEVTTRVGNPTGGGSTDHPNPPEYPEDLASAIKSKFGITPVGFDQQHLKWIWEKLWDVSNTNFDTLVFGTTVNAIQGNGSQQVNCRTIELSNTYPEEVFKVVFTHEMGHIIRNCSSKEDAHYSDHLQARTNEGPVTNYAKTACTYIDEQRGLHPTQWDYESEDYAEMIAYYLNPNAQQQTAACASRGPNPYTNGDHPLHFSVAQSILGIY